MTEGEPPILSPGFSSLSHSLLPRGNQWTALSSMCPFGMLCITISPDGVEPSVYNSKRVTKRTHCSLSVISHKCFVTMTESWQIQISRNSGSYQRGRHKTNKLYLECHTRTRGPGKMGCSCQGKQGALQQKRGRKGEKGLVIGRDIQQLSSLGLVRLGQQSYSDFSEPWARYYLLCILPAGVRTDSSSLCGLLRRFSWDHAWKIVVQRQPRVSCLY